MKVWPDGSAEPSAWNIDTVDGNITGGGWTGVGTYDYGDRPYYDYFSVGANGQTAPAPSAGVNLSVSPANKDYGNVIVGSTSSAQTFTVTSTGGVTLVIGTISITGTNASEFGKLNDNCSGQTLASSATCTIQALFSPASTGAKSANLSIPSNAPTVNAALSGTGTGTTPDLSVSPANKDYGNVTAGSSSSAQTFTVTSTGGAEPRYRHNYPYRDERL